MARIWRARNPRVKDEQERLLVPSSIALLARLL